MRDFHQNHHIFALFDPPQMGNLMTPVLAASFLDFTESEWRNKALLKDWKGLLEVMRPSTYIWSQKNTSTTLDVFGQTIYKSYCEIIDQVKW